LAEYPWPETGLHTRRWGASEAPRANPVTFGHCPFSIAEGPPGTSVNLNAIGSEMRTMGFEKEIFFRNRGTISISEQRKLTSVVVGIIGLGGTGGFAIESLARCGVNSFVLFDFDRVELSNFNRQLLATLPAVDMEKTEVAAVRLKSINLDANVVVYPGKFVSSDFKKLSSCDIVLDCSDNIEAHIAVSDACGKLKIPFVFCSASNASGMCSVVHPQISFRKLMQLPKNKSMLRQYNKCTSIIAPTVALSGTLAASQAINFVLGKQYARAPEFIFFDLFKKEILWKKRL